MFNCILNRFGSIRLKRKHRNKKRKEKNKGHNWAGPSRPTEAQPVVFLLFCSPPELGLGSWL
jgi:hypothetical protein